MQWAGRFILVLFSLCFSELSQAALLQPECAALEKWAREMDPRQKWQLAPSTRLISSLRDDQLVPLFGLPLLEWRQEDFPEVDQVIIACHTQAVSRKDKASASALVKARQAIRGSRAVVHRAQVAYQSAGESVQSLLALPEQPDYLPAVTQAITVLQHGRIDDRILKSLDPVSRTEITRLSKLYPTLPSHYSVQLIAALERRRDRLQQLLPVPMPSGSG